MSEREREERQATEERASSPSTQSMAREERGSDRQEFERAEIDRDQPRQKAEKAGQEESSGLMQDRRWEEFRTRWDSIQAGFVDDPRRTVEQADRLVAEVIDHLSKIFTQERAKLEAQWSKSGEADTEDLRVAMRRYREFFTTLVGGESRP
jgi:hypothetical protein